VNVCKQQICNAHFLATRCSVFVRVDEWLFGMRLAKTMSGNGMIMSVLKLQIVNDQKLDHDADTVDGF